MVVRMQALTKIFVILLVVSPLFFSTKAFAKDNGRSPASSTISPEAVFADPGLKNAMTNPAKFPPPSAFNAHEKHLPELPQALSVPNGRVPSYPSASAF